MFSVTKYVFLPQTNPELLSLESENLLRFLIYGLFWFFFSDWKIRNPRCFKHELNKKERLWSKWKTRFIQRYKTDAAHFLRQHFVSELKFKHQNQGLDSWKSHVVCWINVKGGVKWEIFPPKNLEQYWCFRYTLANIFFIYSVSNNCLSVANFPAKRLRKIRCSKYACADLKKKKLAVNKLNFVYLLYCLIIY